jgi:hypothetical protein
VYPLQVPKGQYRARYAANGMDAGSSVDTPKRAPIHTCSSSGPPPHRLRTRSSSKPVGAPSTGTTRCGNGLVKPVVI